MSTNNKIVIALLLVIVSGASFFGGMKYQQSKRGNFMMRQFGNANQPGQIGQRNGNRTGFRPVNGEIITKDDQGVTVKMTDGSTKIVLISDKTTINKATEATKDDLKQGENVAVFGQENSDGSVTAQNIQINPVLRSQMPSQSN